MKKNQTSIDGFVPRNRASTTNRKVGGVSKPQIKTKTAPKKSTVEQPKPTPKGSPQKTKHEDLDAVLKNLDVAVDNSRSELREKTRRISKKDAKLAKQLQKCNKNRQKKNKKPVGIKQFVNRRRWKRAFLTLVLVIVLGGGFIAYKTFGNFNRIFGGNVLDLIKKEKLIEDDLGRTNILVFGTSPDGWDGQDLTDSIMVVSLNQETGDAYTVSLPRDLWVSHECEGWLNTTAGRLNESYGCGRITAQNSGETDESAEKIGQDSLAKSATEVLGLDIHYKVHANWQVLIDMIDSIGGIDVKVEAYDGSPEVYDVATDIRYKNGEIVHFNGERALAFSRARGSAGGTGFSRGNFDRELNQQKILKATIDKIKTSGKNNPVALIGMVDALGASVKTSFKPSEIQTLAQFAGGFDPAKIVSLPLIDEDNDISLMTTGNVSGASVVLPTAGVFNYSDIKAYISKNTNQDPVVKEEAKIVILNGTKISGLAGEQAEELSAEGLNVVEFDTAQNQDYKKYIIYKNNDDKPKTVEKLISKFKAGSAQNTPESLAKYSDADIIIVIGEDE